MSLTENPCSFPAATGIGNGLSEASPYTFSQIITEIKSVSGTGGRGIRYNVETDGAYSRTSSDDIGGAAPALTQSLW